ncbi:protein adenylyltransferase SelO [Arcticibacterium luteifluviistationis]|uniref:Protein nucleotidyltransferase YdiU n=1 Tax=Arcticibacterium luteifluviistationis TaxID=1784714 RepID=A0A2Z4GGN5_9BACT|nr:YdiU family protein [Arcticibacterium luteifluviistationis]AWW00563.1 YdiU family protein [Arcticibacterium luteifluviistationis]
MKLNIDNTFTNELPADEELNVFPRQVSDACFSFVKPRVPSEPKILHYSSEMTSAIGLSKEEAESEDFTKIFSGTEVYQDTKPYAMCYGGHQFGNWAGQLGDGRAINLFEVVKNNKRWALQLKGSGLTPYSRTADGLAVLRSSVREHLCSEAMFHLGVPTTRSLSLALTGDQVLRDVQYNGNPAYEKGAVVCRLAPSFIRFGNFQILTARQDRKNLRLLMNYTIRHFFPGITENTKEGYIQFFKKVSKDTLKMVMDWQRVGFVHGVMNTDNMSILGLTIDFGPYGWLEGYDKNWTPNTTDSQHRRYRFGQQPNVALWNLAQLGSALNLIVDDVPALENILNEYQDSFTLAYQKMMRDKLGFNTEEDTDELLFQELEKTLHLTETDMTIFYRNLANFKKDETLAANSTALDFIKDSFYSPEELKDETLQGWLNWLKSYQTRLLKEDTSDEARKAKMNAVNPKYVLRNYMSQLAIDAADNGDYSLISELHELLKKPYENQPENEKWFAKRPEWARNKVGCSMLSCSS